MKRLCCHTPARSCYNRTRQQVNTVSAHLKSWTPVSHQVPNCSIRNSEVSIERATKLEDLENKGGPAGTLIYVAGDNKTPQGAGGKLE